MYFIPSIQIFLNNFLGNKRTRDSRQVFLIPELKGAGREFISMFQESNKLIHFRKWTIERKFFGIGGSMASLKGVGEYPCRVMAVKRREM